MTERKPFTRGGTAFKFNLAVQEMLPAKYVMA